MKSIDKYLQAGWIISDENDYVYHLYRIKSFGWLWCFFWFIIVPFIGALMYIVYYIATKNENKMVKK